ncbi:MULTISPECIES: hypothetical protein [Methylobacterium]|nr:MULTISPECIES: hypothetical protein [Methylobacterium]GBU18044.1 hypothetical protein AwMethylo_22590 [Methylobacterium sp.]
MTSDNPDLATYDLVYKAWRAREADLHGRAWDRYEAQSARIAEIGEEAYLAEARAKAGSEGFVGIFGHPGHRGVPDDLEYRLRQTAELLPYLLKELGVQDPR